MTTEVLNENKALIDALIRMLNILSNDERKEIFSNFCKECGSKSESCYCMRDK